MQFLEMNVPRVHKLYLASDFHDGSANRHRDGQLALYERIAKEKDSRLLEGGDDIEGIVVDDKRYIQESVDTKTSVPLLQAQNCVKERWEIRKKIVGKLIGNHEVTLLKFGNLMRDIICKDLGVPYGTYTCVLTVRDLQGKQMYKVFYTHGRRNIGSTSEDPKRRKANMEYQLKKHLYRKMADCLIMAEGHHHKLLISEPEPELQLVSTGKRLHQTYTRNPGSVREIPPDLRYYAGTGSYRGLYGEPGKIDYGEIGGYDPEELGSVCFHMNGDTVEEAEKVIV